MNSRLIAGITAAVLALSTAACGGGSASKGATGGDEQLVIGLITEDSGPWAAYGTNIGRAWHMAVEEQNAKGGINGKDIKIIEQKTDGTAARALAQARKSVAAGAQVITGPATSAEFIAIQKQASSLQGALTLSTSAGADQLTGEYCAPNSFSFAPSATMQTAGMAAASADWGVKKWAIIAGDYPTAHDSIELFKKTLDKQGAKVLKEIFTPVGISDYGPYISELAASGADGLFVEISGSDGVTFVKQASQFNLFNKFATRVGYNLVTLPDLPALGKPVVDFLVNEGYDAAADNDLNKAFAAKWESEYKSTPYWVNAYAYLAAQALFAAADEAGTNDPAKIAAAMNDLTFDSIVGQVKVRAGDHQLLAPTHVGQVVNEGDQLKIKVMQTMAASITSPEPNAACRMP